MEEILSDIIEKLSQKQKFCKTALSKVKKLKIAFSKGDFKKIHDEFDKNEFEDILAKLQLKTEIDKLRQTYNSYKSKLRLEFDSKFIEECKKFGVEKITGNSMDQFRVKGIVSIKINFSNNLCDINTFAKTKKVRSVAPKVIAKEVYQEVKRLFERKFDPNNFLLQLYEAYNHVKTPSSSQVFLKEIHQIIWINNQSQKFFEKSEPNKMFTYPIDEFSVDLSKLLESKVDRLKNGFQCKLLLGRDGVNIYRGMENFNSYKFIEFVKEGERHG